MTNDQQKAVDDLKAEIRKYENQMDALQAEKDEIRKHKNKAQADLNKIEQDPDQQMLPYSVIDNDRKAKQESRIG